MSAELCASCLVVDEAQTEDGILLCVEGYSISKTNTAKPHSFRAYQNFCQLALQFTNRVWDSGLNRCYLHGRKLLDHRKMGLPKTVGYALQLKTPKAT